MEKTQFGIVGAGWRAEFYMRIARARPDLFDIDGVVVRNPQKAADFAARWGCPVYGTTVELLLRHSPAVRGELRPVAGQPGGCARARRERYTRAL